jgi:hypothetical protein
MKFHIVRAIKQYPYYRVANALDAAGYVWKGKRTGNTERLLTGIPRCDLLFVLRYLEQTT